MSDNGSDAKVLRIGSRDSELAMKQTNLIKDALQEIHPKLKFEIVTMKTKGDKILDLALSKIGSKSLFTKELEVALENDLVDIVVHSLKDLPTTLPEGLVIGAVTEREDPRDAVIMHPKYSDRQLSTLPKGSVIGTSSLRRGAQLKRKFPDLEFQSVRGNLNTRFRKLDEADNYSALVLAVAGVVRMGWKERISQYLNEDLCMYAVGQGALAIECREDDTTTLELLSVLSHPDTTLAAAAERAFMRTLEGGCSAPVAVHTKITEKDGISLKGGVWSLDGKEELIHTLSTTPELPNGKNDVSSEPEVKRPRTPLNTFCGLVDIPKKQVSMSQAYNLGVSLGQYLLKEGAKTILAEAKAKNEAMS